MLKFFRKKNIAKIIFWGLVILILPPFILWGTGNIGRMRAKGPSYVGLIENKKVSFEELFESIVSIRCQVVLNYFNQPKVLEVFLTNRPFLAKLAWDRLIMLRESRKRGMRVPNDEVVNVIRSHPIFSRNGQFDDKIYDYVLRYNIGLDPRKFEEIVRENMVIQKLSEGLTKDISITDEEVLWDYRENHEKFRISYRLADSTTETETPLFSKSDYLEGIGEADAIVEAAAKLKAGDLSGPIETRKGVLTFKLLETQGFDEDKFKKEKDDYSKKALEKKRNKFLENWLRGLESKARLNIDLEDYEKYYR